MSELQPAPIDIKSDEIANIKKELDTQMAGEKVGSPGLIALNDIADRIEAQGKVELKQQELKENKLPEKDLDIRFDLLEAELSLEQIRRDIGHRSSAIPGYLKAHDNLTTSSGKFMRAKEQEYIQSKQAVNWPDIYNRTNASLQALRDRVIGTGS